MASKDWKFGLGGDFLGGALAEFGEWGEGGVGGLCGEAGVVAVPGELGEVVVTGGAVGVAVGVPEGALDEGAVDDGEGGVAGEALLAGEEFFADEGFEVGVGDEGGELGAELVEEVARGVGLVEGVVDDDSFAHEVGFGFEDGVVAGEAFEGVVVGGEDAGGEGGVWGLDEDVAAGVGVEAALSEGVAEGLEDHAVGGDDVEVARGDVEALPAPVDGVGLGESPVEGAVAGVEVAHGAGVEFVGVAQGAEAEVGDEFLSGGCSEGVAGWGGAGFGDAGGGEGVAACGAELGDEGGDIGLGEEGGFGWWGVDEGVEVGGGAVPEFAHFGGPLAAVEIAGGVGVSAEFVLEEPAEFVEEARVSGVVAEAFVAEEGDSAADPAPAFFGAFEEDADVVGEVPGVIGPDAGEAGFEFGDPVGELDEFEVAAFVLQAGGANPEDVGDDAAEAAERDGGEDDEGRGVDHGVGLGDAVLAARFAQGLVEARCAEEAGEEE